MIPAAASVLGLTYAFSELGLALRKRAKAREARILDDGSLRLLWMVILASNALAFCCCVWIPRAAIPGGPLLRACGIGLFAAGLAIRWAAIIHLGRYFTVDVAIAADQRLNDTGPYRIVRHPSYTGALMAFSGLGLCLENWVSLAVLVVPIVSVFLRRMHIEEAALLQAFGQEYRDYMQRTRRLIPAVY